jgi:uncharacterized RDD family membrane protein YckC
VANCQVCGASLSEGANFCTACGSPHESPLASPHPSYPTPAPTEVAGEAPAGFWWRVLGYLIDSLVLWLVASLPLENSHVSAHAAAAITLALAAVYFWFFVRFRGATIGMMLCRMRCVSETGARMTGSQVVARTATYVVFLALASIYVVSIYQHPNAAERRTEIHEIGIYFLLALPHLIEMLWAAWDPRHQTLHDKAARSLVVRRSPV